MGPRVLVLFLSCSGGLRGFLELNGYAISGLLADVGSRVIGLSLGGRPTTGLALGTAKPWDVSGISLHLKVDHCGQSNLGRVCLLPLAHAFQLGSDSGQGQSRGVGRGGLMRLGAHGRFSPV